MSVNVVGLAASRKTPGVYLSVILGGPGTSAGAAPLSICCVGNMIATAITGSSPSFTIAAGTEQASGTANETPVQVFDKDEAASKFGKGSELHLMAAAVFAQYPDAMLYCCPVAEGGGAARAAGTLVFTTTATGSGTLRLIINGVNMEIGVLSGDTVSAIAAAVCQKVLDNTDLLPVTAEFSTGTVTFTAKQKGTRGNNILLRAYWVNGTTVTKIGTSTASGFGTSATIASALTLGATADSITNALAAMAPTLYDRIAIAHDDSTNGGLLRDHLDSMAGVTTMLWAQGVMAVSAAPGATQTITAAMNASRVQVVSQEKAEMTTGEIAAQAAAARLAGDSIVGGSITGEASDPACNLDGVMLKTIKVQALASDIPTQTEIETLLNYGATPLVPSPNHPGYVQIPRSITSRHKSGASFNYAVLDTSEVTIVDYAARQIRNDLTITFAGYKLASDSEDDAQNPISQTATPKDIKARVLFNLFQLESRGIIRNVTAHLPELVVEEDPVTRGRVNMNIPIEPIPGLHVMGGNVRQVS